MAYELLLDSFETALSASRWVVKESPNSSLTVPSAGNGRRSGGSSMRQVTTSGYIFARTQYFAASSHVVTGVAFRSSIPTRLSQIRFLSQNSSSVAVAFYVGGFLQYNINNGPVTATSKVILANTWYYLEIGAVIAANGAFRVKLNGEIIVDLTNIDTRAAGSITSVDNVEYYNNYTTTDYDDFYLTYGNELKWLGDIRVDALALTGNSTPQDWVPDSGNAWERLNATAGYITGTTLNQESRFTLADYTPATTAIHGIQMSASARKTDAGSKSMALEIKSGGTVALSSAIALGDSTADYRRVFTLDPDTSSEWTDAGIDALEIGVKVVD